MAGHVPLEEGCAWQEAVVRRGWASVIETMITWQMVQLLARQGRMDGSGGPLVSRPTANRLPPCVAGYGYLLQDSIDSRFLQMMFNVPTFKRPYMGLQRAVNEMKRRVTKYYQQSTSDVRVGAQSHR